MKENLPHAVFVYGTLMRGERAAHLMTEGEYVGEYVLSGYALYDLGNYPGILAKAGEEVAGEVYYVSDAMLSAMDDYEDEGSLYHRRKVTVTGEGAVLACGSMSMPTPMMCADLPWAEAGGKNDKKRGIPRFFCAATNS